MSVYIYGERAIKREKGVVLRAFDDADIHAFLFRSLRFLLIVSTPWLWNELNYGVWYVLG